MDASPTPRVPCGRIWRVAEDFSHRHRAWLEAFDHTQLADGMVNNWHPPPRAAQPTPRFSTWSLV